MILEELNEIYNNMTILLYIWAFNHKKNHEKCNSDTYVGITPQNGVIPTYHLCIVIFQWFFIFGKIGNNVKKLQNMRFKTSHYAYFYHIPSKSYKRLKKVTFLQQKKQKLIFFDFLKKWRKKYFLIPFFKRL